MPSTTKRRAAAEPEAPVVERTGEGREIMESPERMRPWPALNPRRRPTAERVRQIAASIRDSGQLQNVVGRRDPASGELWILAGGTRWLAGLLVVRGEPEFNIPPRPDFRLRVLELDISEGEALKLALLENVQREDLSVVEEAEAYQRLIQQHHYTQAELADVVLGGKDKAPQISNLLGILALPDPVLELIHLGVIPYRAARDTLKTTLRRISEERRETVFRGLVRRVAELTGAPDAIEAAVLAQEVGDEARAELGKLKITGEWIAEWAREQESIDQGLAGQVGMFAAEVGAPRLAVASEEEQVDALIRAALEPTASWAEVWDAADPCSDKDLRNQLALLPTHDSFQQHSGGAGAYRLQHVGQGVAPVLLTLHPKSGSAPWQLREEQLLTAVRRVYGIGYPAEVADEPAEPVPSAFVPADEPAAPVSSAAVPAGEPAAPVAASLEDQVDYLLTDAFTRFAPERLWEPLVSAGATDAEIAAAIRAALIGRVGATQGQYHEGMGTWMHAADEWILRVSIIPQATRKTVHVRDEVLIAHARRLLGIDVPPMDSPEEPAGAVRGVCRECGCTDEDCSGCIERTGAPCSWVEPDLCSACVPEPAVQEESAPVPTAQPAPASPPAGNAQQRATPSSPAPPAPQRTAAAATPPPARSAPAPASAPAPSAPLATLPLPGTGRAPVPEGAGIIEAIVAATGGRPCTIAITPIAGNVMVIVAPRIAKAGESPLTITKPASAVDAELIHSIDSHFN